MPKRKLQQQPDHYDIPPSTQDADSFQRIDIQNSSANILKLINLDTSCAVSNVSNIKFSSQCVQNNSRKVERKPSCGFETLLEAAKIADSVQIKQSEVLVTPSSNVAQSSFTNCYQVLQNPSFQQFNGKPSNLVQLTGQHPLAKGPDLTVASSPQFLTVSSSNANYFDGKEIQIKNPSEVSQQNFAGESRITPVQTNIKGDGSFSIKSNIAYVAIPLAALPVLNVAEPINAAYSISPTSVFKLTASKPTQEQSPQFRNYHELSSRLIPAEQNVNQVHELNLGNSQYLNVREGGGILSSHADGKISNMNEIRVSGQLLGRPLVHNDQLQAASFKPDKALVEERPYGLYSFDNLKPAETTKIVSSSGVGSADSRINALSEASLMNVLQDKNQIGKVGSPGMKQQIVYAVPVGNTRTRLADEGHRVSHVEGSVPAQNVILFDQVGLQQSGLTGEGSHSVAMLRGRNSPSVMYVQSSGVETAREIASVHQFTPGVESVQTAWSAQQLHGQLYQNQYQNQQINRVQPMLGTQHLPVAISSNCYVSSLYNPASQLSVLYLSGDTRNIIESKPVTGYSTGGLGGEGSLREVRSSPVAHAERIHSPVSPSMRISAGSSAESEESGAAGKGKDDGKPKRHVCPYCNKGWSKPSVLEKHIRAHTGERPYPCNSCGFEFKTKSNLYKHCKSRAHQAKLASGSSTGSSNSSLAIDGSTSVDIEHSTEDPSVSASQGSLDCHIPSNTATTDDDVDDDDEDDDDEVECRTGAVKDNEINVNTPTSDELQRVKLKESDKSGFQISSLLVKASNKEVSSPSAGEASRYRPELYRQIAVQLPDDPQYNEQGTPTVMPLNPMRVIPIEHKNDISTSSVTQISSPSVMQREYLNESAGRKLSSELSVEKSSHKQNIPLSKFQEIKSAVTMAKEKNKYVDNAIQLQHGVAYMMNKIGKPEIVVPSVGISASNGFTNRSEAFTSNESSYQLASSNLSESTSRDSQALLVANILKSSPALGSNSHSQSLDKSMFMSAFPNPSSSKGSYDVNVDLRHTNFNSEQNLTPSVETRVNGYEADNWPNREVSTAGNVDKHLYPPRKALQRGVAVSFEEDRQAAWPADEFRNKRAEYKVGERGKQRSVDSKHHLDPGNGKKLAARSLDDELGAHAGFTSTTSSVMSRSLSDVGCIEKLEPLDPKNLTPEALERRITALINNNAKVIDTPMASPPRSKRLFRHCSDLSTGDKKNASFDKVDGAAERNGRSGAVKQLLRAKSLTPVVPTIVLTEPTGEQSRVCNPAEERIQQNNANNQQVMTSKNNAAVKHFNSQIAENFVSCENAMLSRGALPRYLEVPGGMEIPSSCFSTQKLCHTFSLPVPSWTPSAVVGSKPMSSSDDHYNRSFEINYRECRKDFSDHTDTSYHFGRNELSENSLSERARNDSRYISEDGKVRSEISEMKNKRQCSEELKTSRPPKLSHLHHHPAVRSLNSLDTGHGNFKDTATYRHSFDSLDRQHGFNLNSSALDTTSGFTKVNESVSGNVLHIPSQQIRHKKFGIHKSHSEDSTLRRSSNISSRNAEFSGPHLLNAPYPTLSSAEMASDARSDYSSNFDKASGRIQSSLSSFSSTPSLVYQQDSIMDTSQGPRFVERKDSSSLDGDKYKMNSDLSVSIDSSSALMHRSGSLLNHQQSRLQTTGSDYLYVTNNLNTSSQSPPEMNTPSTDAHTTRGRPKGSRNKPKQIDTVQVSNASYDQMDENGDYSERNVKTSAEYHQSDYTYSSSSNVEKSDSSDPSSLWRHKLKDRIMKRTHIQPDNYNNSNKLHTVRSLVSSASLLDQSIELSGTVISDSLQRSQSYDAAVPLKKRRKLTELGRGTAFGTRVEDGVENAPARGESFDLEYLMSERSDSTDSCGKNEQTVRKDNDVPDSKNESLNLKDTENKICQQNLVSSQMRNSIKFSSESFLSQGAPGIDEDKLCVIAKSGMEIHLVKSLLSKAAMCEKLEAKPEILRVPRDLALELRGIVGNLIGSLDFDAVISRVGNVMEQHVRASPTVSIGTNVAHNTEELECRIFSTVYDSQHKIKLLESTSNMKSVYCPTSSVAALMATEDIVVIDAKNDEANMNRIAAALLLIGSRFPRLTSASAVSFSYDIKDAALMNFRESTNNTSEYMNLIIKKITDLGSSSSKPWQPDWCKVKCGRTCDTNTGVLYTWPKLTDVKSGILTHSSYWGYSRVHNDNQQNKNSFNLNMPYYGNAKLVEVVESSNSNAAISSSSNSVVVSVSYSVDSETRKEFKQLSPSKSIGHDSEMQSSLKSARESPIANTGSIIQNEPNETQCLNLERSLHEFTQHHLSTSLTSSSFNDNFKEFPLSLNNEPHSALAKSGSLGFAVTTSTLESMKRFSVSSSLSHSTSSVASSGLDNTVESKLPVSGPYKPKSLYMFRSIGESALSSNSILPLIKVPTKTGVITEHKYSSLKPINLYMEGVSNTLVTDSPLSEFPKLSFSSSGFSSGITSHNVEKHQVKTSNSVNMISNRSVENQNCSHLGLVADRSLTAKSFEESNNSESIKNMFSVVSSILTEQKDSRAENMRTQDSEVDVTSLKTASSSGNHLKSVLGSKLMQRQVAIEVDADKDQRFEPVRSRSLGFSGYSRNSSKSWHVCSLCGIRCRKFSLLRKHLHSHSDVRLFYCFKCDLSFKTKGNLSKHMKTKQHLNAVVNNKSEPEQSFSLSFSTNKEESRNTAEMPASNDGMMQLCAGVNSESIHDGDSDPLRNSTVDISMEKSDKCSSETIIKSLASARSILTCNVPAGIPSHSRSVDEALISCNSDQSVRDHPVVSSLADLSRTSSSDQGYSSDNMIEERMSSSASGSLNNVTVEQQNLSSKEEDEPLGQGGMDAEKDYGTGGAHGGRRVPLEMKPLPGRVSIVPEDERKDGKFVCSLCNKEFREEHQLTLHKKVHDMELPFRCTLCVKSFPNQAMYDRHVRKSASHISLVDAQKMSADVSASCNSFSLPNDPVDPRPFKCVECSTAFRSKGHLTKHYNSKAHSNQLSLFPRNSASQLPEGNDGLQEEFSEGLNDEENSRDEIYEDGAHDLHENEMNSLTDRVPGAFDSDQHRNHDQMCAATNHDQMCAATSRNSLVTFRSDISSAVTQNTLNAGVESASNSVEVRSTVVTEKSNPVKSSEQSTGEVLSCPLCSEAIYNITEFQIHLLTHVERRSFICHLCDAGFTNQQALDTHSRIHESGS